MKSLAKMIFCCISIMGVAALFSSCTEDGPDTPGGNEPSADFTGTSFILLNEENASLSATLEFEGSWEVSNQSTWFSVTPLSGDAGTKEITVMAVDTTTTLTERVASFMIDDNGTTTQYYVIQLPVSGFSIESATAEFSTEASSYTFSFQSNVSFETALGEGMDWVTIESVKAVDSTLLADNSTYSRLRTYEVAISVTENSEEQRGGFITLNGENGITETLEVVQMGTSLVADYSREFLRRTLAMRFTGNWCGYCPNMNVALHEAIEQYPDHIVAMNLYSGSGALTYSKISTFESMFGVEGYPSAYMNYYVNIGNVTPYSIVRDRFIDLAQEATFALPANTAIGGTVSTDGTTVTAQLSIASKDAGEYRLVAFLLEDHIIGSQSDYAGVVDNPNEYDHSNVVRVALTEISGNAVTLNAEGISNQTLTVNIPNSVRSNENLHVVAYLLQEGTFRGSVAGVSYGNYGYVVDNVVDIPVGGYAMFRYEE